MSKTSSELTASADYPSPLSLWITPNCLVNTIFWESSQACTQFDTIAVLEEIDDPPPLFDLKSFGCICSPILEAIDWIFPNRQLTLPITGCLVS